MPEALQAANNTVIFSWLAPEVVLLATFSFGAITLHLSEAVGKPDSSRFHIFEERNYFSDITFSKVSQSPETINGFEAADFPAEDIMLAFFKLILLCFIKLLTHFLPGLLFLKGVLSLFKI